MSKVYKPEIGKRFILEGKTYTVVSINPIDHDIIIGEDKDKNIVEANRNKVLWRTGL